MPANSFCSSCGASVPADGQFCPSCGKKTGSAKKGGDMSSGKKALRLLLVGIVAIFIGLTISSNMQKDSENKASRSVCETVYGAGMCVETSDGDWRPYGGRP